MDLDMILSCLLIVVMLVGLIQYGYYKYDRYKTNKMMVDYYASDEYKQSQKEWHVILDPLTNNHELKALILKRNKEKEKNR